MELKYKSWNDITLGVFERLEREIENNSVDDIGLINTNVNILSILCDVDVEEIERLDLTEFSRLVGECDFLKSPIYNIFNDKYTINGRVYNVMCSVNQFTTAQFIDFQTYYKNGVVDKRAEILSCMLVPSSCKYSEGYDVVDVINDIRNYLPITDVLGLLDFFLRSYQVLTKQTLTYSVKMLKKMMKKEKNTEKKELMKEQIKMMESKLMDL